jgi:hypothetical protein
LIVRARKIVLDFFNLAAIHQRDRAEVSRGIEG